MALNKALGIRVGFKGTLTKSLLNTVAVASFDVVGRKRMASGSVGKIAVHTLIGGLMARASEVSFLVGAALNTSIFSAKFFQFS